MKTLCTSVHIVLLFKKNLSPTQAHIVASPPFFFLTLKGLARLKFGLTLKVLLGWPYKLTQRNPCSMATTFQWARNKVNKKFENMK